MQSMWVPQNRLPKIQFQVTEICYARKSNVEKKTPVHSAAMCYNVQGIKA